MAVAWDRSPPLVSGEQVFRDRIADALALLETGRPDWQLLVDSLHVIRPGRADDAIAGPWAGLVVGDGGYVAVITRHISEIAYLASVLAHLAWHARQHEQGRAHTGTAAEQEARAVQAAVLGDIAPGHPAGSLLLSQIPGPMDHVCPRDGEWSQPHSADLSA